MKLSELPEDLISTAKKSSWKDQPTILKMEDSLIEKREPLLLRKEEFETVKRYLALGSIPYTVNSTDEEKDRENLQKIWPEKFMQLRDEVANRPPSLPTGNLQAFYMVIGDAPGRGSSPGKYDRILTYGPSSHILRKSLYEAGIYFQCWFTNLSKFSTPENRPTTHKEVMDQKMHLRREIRLIHPKYIILLGQHASGMFQENFSQYISEYNIGCYTISHPAYMSRMNKSIKEYTEHIAEKLEDAL